MTFLLEIVLATVSKPPRFVIKPQLVTYCNPRKIVKKKVKVKKRKTDSNQKYVCSQILAKLALPPPCSPPCLSSSTSSSSQLSRFVVQSSHRHHPHHRVLVEFSLAVHQLRPAPLNPHSLVHLADQTRLEGPNHFHGKFNFLSSMRNQTMFPQRNVHKQDLLSLGVTSHFNDTCFHWHKRFRELRKICALVFRLCGACCLGGVEKDRIEF